MTVCKLLQTGWSVTDISQPAVQRCAGYTTQHRATASKTQCPCTTTGITQLHRMMMTSRAQQCSLNSTIGRATGYNAGLSQNGSGLPADRSAWLLYVQYCTVRTQVGLYNAIKW